MLTEFLVGRDSYRFRERGGFRCFSRGQESWFDGNGYWSRYKPGKGVFNRAFPYNSPTEKRTISLFALKSSSLANFIVNTVLTFDHSRTFLTISAKRYIQDMLARAHQNAIKSSIPNVRFVESHITSIALPSSSADCIISNCVINLVPPQEKHLVFGEMFRLLKPGGRVAVSDILAKKEFPADLQRDISLYVGCISGASTVEEYEKWLKDVGFKGIYEPSLYHTIFINIVNLQAADIMIVDKNNDLNIYKEDTRKIEKDQQTAASGCCSVGKRVTISMGTKSSGCCGPTQTVVEEEAPIGGSRGCCGTSNEAGQGVNKSDADINFNEWAGKTIILFSSQRHLC